MLIFLTTLPDRPFEQHTSSLRRRLAPSVAQFFSSAGLFTHATAG